tara:strand:- start:2855 stop:3265 length:411 start_codon:yes stop_codon:yes gene_type:complete
MRKQWTRFEKPADIARELKAMQTLADLYGWSFKKLGEYDVDFYITGVGYLEVKGRLRNMADAFPLPLAERKYKKLIEKPLNSIIVWGCLDGLIYADLSKITFTKRYGGRTPRNGSSNDQELMYFVSEQDALVYVDY